MIYSISGNLGSGKTTIAVILVKWLSLRGYKVQSNIWLNFPFTKLDFSIENLKKSFNMVQLIDEIGMYAPSRRSMSKFNIKFNEYVRQTRKRGITLIYTEQRRRGADIGIRDLANYVIACEKDTPNKCFKYQISTGTKYVEIKLPFYKAELIFPMFDTSEIIEPLQIRG